MPEKQEVFCNSKGSLKNSKSSDGKFLLITVCLFKVNSKKLTAHKSQKQQLVPLYFTHCCRAARVAQQLNDREEAAHLFRQELN